MVRTHEIMKMAEDFDTELGFICLGSINTKKDNTFEMISSHVWLALFVTIWFPFMILHSV